MSIYVMSLVWRKKFGNVYSKTVALKLADFANDDGESIFPSIATLMEHCEISESTAHRSIKAFLDKGILQIVREGGGRLTNSYKLNLDRIDRLPDMRGVSQTPVSPGTCSRSSQTPDSSLNHQAISSSQESLEKEGKEESKTQDAREDFATDEEAAFDCYNQWALSLGWSVATKLTAERTRKLKLRVKDAGGIEKFYQVIEKLGGSEFGVVCGAGKGDRAWKIDLDWLLEPKKFLQISEGRYAEKVREGNGTGFHSYR